MAGCSLSSGERARARGKRPPEQTLLTGMNPGKISIIDLEVFYHVGVPDAERAQPQRLLLTVEMESDFSAAAQSDSIADTIDYFTVTQRLLKFGDGKSWKLIEKLAADIADMVLGEFKPKSVSVEVKKFIIPQARYVSVNLKRQGN
jgi:7,8-dihydroneopterin aldolase/epimerase/oxygenase